MKINLEYLKAKIKGLTQIEANRQHLMNIPICDSFISALRCGLGMFHSIRAPFKDKNKFIKIAVYDLLHLYFGWNS